MTGVFLSVPRYAWCASLSHPSSCMFVNHGPSLPSSKEEYKPWKWGAAAKVTMRLIQRPCHTRGSPCQDPVGNRTTRRPDHRKETQTAVVIRSGQNHPARGKKTKQTEEKVGRQHQGIDRSGVRQVPEGSGEQRTRRKLVLKLKKLKSETELTAPFLV